MSLAVSNAEVVRTVREYLTTANLQECTWHTLADAIGVPYYMVQYRLQCQGTSWARLKREEKTRRLDALLEKPGKVDLWDLAETCGYDNPGSFLVFFKQARCETFTDWRIRRQTA